MRIHIRTYGCQMNERDSEAVASLLSARGHTIVAAENDADAVLVNTCSVRAKAEEKALGKLGLLVAGRTRRPGLIVGAIGCMVERMGPRIAEKVKGLDLAVGVHRLAALPDAIAAAQKIRGGKTILDLGDSGADGAALCGHEAGALSAFVTVLQGCDRKCTYCIVPFVRGGERSRLPGDIITEVRDAVRLGAKDITLLGQSVMSYGRARDPWVGAPPSRRGFTEAFPRLLESVADVAGVERLRFTSSHPSGCTDEMAKAFRELRPLCEHVHLPLQSGSDRLLAMMGRGYTAVEYAHAVGRLRHAAPGLAVTTDVIVGFPTETEEDFEATRRLMDEIGFDNAFVFKYSPRPGTEATRLADDVPQAEKERRNGVLLADQDRRGAAINARILGHDVEVLVEGPSLRNRSKWSGRTRTNKIAIFAPVDGVGRGDLVRVRIERSMPQTLHGTVIGKDCAERSAVAREQHGGCGD